MQPQLRLLILGPVLEGAFEIVVHALDLELVQHGIDVHVIALAGDENRPDVAWA